MSIFRFIVLSIFSLSAISFVQQNEQSSLEPVELPASQNWKQLKGTEGRTVWLGERGNYYYIKATRGKCAVPMDDVDALRQYVRGKAKEWKGGLIEAKYLELNGRTCAWYIIKSTAPGLTGYRYLGRCVVPFDGGYHEIGMDAVPVGATGRREALLAIRLKLYANPVMEQIPKEAPPTPGRSSGNRGQRVKGLFRDPYDRRFDAPGNYWITDDAKYDREFPRHSLSRLRAKFPQVLKTMKVPQD